MALMLSPHVWSADGPRTHLEEDVSARERWFASRRTSANGDEPWKLRLRAANQLRANLDTGKLHTSETGDMWISIGPSPFTDMGRPFTGRVTAIATHPTDPSTVWVGTANGGVWKTADGGATWTPKTDLEDTLAIGAVAIDRNNPQTVWVGTGEANAPFCPIYGGVGLLKTTDGGATWSPLGQAVFAGSGISAVVLHPTNPQVLWVANRVAQHGTGVCASSAGPYGVWKSSDGGATWSLKLGGAQSVSTDGSVSDLQISPADPNRLLAGMPGSGVWRSIDGGTTWGRVNSGLPGGQGRVEIAFDPVTPTTVYVSEEAAVGGHLDVFKSTNSGNSFTTVAKPGAGFCMAYALSDICTYADVPLAQCFFYHDLAVGPDHDVWLAALGVARSSDGGASWTHVCQSNVHVDQHALAFGADGRVWLGNDGGVMSTTDDGVSWTSHAAGLDVAQFYAGPSAHPTNPSSALGGTQDNGALAFAGGSSWHYVFGGDNWRTAFSTSWPDTHWYVAAAAFNIYKTTDAGKHWTFASDGIPPGEPAENDMPWLACPDDASAFIAVSNNVWRSDDDMAIWAPNSPDPLEATSVTGTAATFLPKGNGCQTYFAGFRNGALWRTVDAGASWTKIGSFAGIVSDLRSDPRAPATIWVTLQGFGVPHVWRSTNALDALPSWTRRDAGLPDCPVNAVAVDRKRIGVVWLGTDLGIFRSDDDGGSWSPLTAGHPRAIVMGFAEGEETREVLSFTHGRGAFRLVADCGGACPPVAAGLVASKGTAEATFTWDAVSCSSLDGYVLYAATQFAAPFPSEWTIVETGDVAAHVEPLSSPYVAFRAVTENACGERSN